MHLLAFLLYRNPFHQANDRSYAKGCGFAGVDNPKRPQPMHRLINLRGKHCIAANAVPFACGEDLVEEKQLLHFPPCRACHGGVHIMSFTDVQDCLHQCFAVFHRPRALAHQLDEGRGRWRGQAAKRAQGFYRHSALVLQCVVARDASNFAGVHEGGCALELIHDRENRCVPRHVCDWDCRSGCREHVLAAVDGK